MHVCVSAGEARGVTRLETRFRVGRQFAVYTARQELFFHDQSGDAAVGDV